MNCLPIIYRNGLFLLGSAILEPPAICAFHRRILKLSADAHQFQSLLSIIFHQGSVIDNVGEHDGGKLTPSL